MYVPPVNLGSASGANSENPQLVQLVNQCWLDFRWMADNYGGGGQPSVPPLSVIQSALNSLQGMISYLKGMPAGSLTAADQTLLANAEHLSAMLGTSAAGVQQFYSTDEGAFQGILSLMDPTNSPYPMAQPNASNATIQADFQYLQDLLGNYNYDSENSQGLPPAALQALLNKDLSQLASAISTLSKDLGSGNITDGPLLALKNLLEMPLNGTSGESLLSLAEAVEQNPNNQTDLTNLETALNGSSTSNGFGEGSSSGSGQLTVFLQDVFYWEYKVEQ